MKKGTPVGCISLREAFQLYYEHLWKDSPRLEPLPKGDLKEHLGRSEDASEKLSEAFANGNLECRVFANGQEWRVTALRWRDSFSPEHTFFDGSFVDGPYAGLYPFIDEAVFKKWLGPSRKRGRKPIYPAAEFHKKAREVLANMGPSFFQPTFNAVMQEWCLDQWERGPGETWIKKHLVLALKEYEQATLI